MKKTICVLLAFIVCAISLCACGGTEQTKNKDIRKTMYAELSGFYKGKHLTSYLEAAALCAAGEDLAAYDCSELFADGVNDAQYVISCCFLKKAGAPQESESAAAERISKLEEAIRTPDALDIASLCDTVAALELYGAEYDRAAVAESLLSRQDEISGGFYEFPHTSGTSSHISALNTAAALTAYMLIRHAVRSQIYEDSLHDSALLYLGDCMEDDNTVKNGSGVSSSAATAQTLSALIACDIPQNGEISTSLLSAIHNFAAISDGVLYGYRDTADGETKRDTAAAILFCVTSTLYGNPYFAEETSAAGGITETNN